MNTKVYGMRKQRQHETTVFTPILLDSLIVIQDRRGWENRLKCKSATRYMAHFMQAKFDWVVIFVGEIEQIVDRNKFLNMLRNLMSVL